MADEIFRLTLDDTPSENVSVTINDTSRPAPVTLLRKIQDYDNTSNYSGGGTGYDLVTKSYLFPALNNTYHNFRMVVANATRHYLGTGAVNLSGSAGFTWEFAVRFGTSPNAVERQVFGDGYGNSDTHVLKFDPQANNGRWFFRDRNWGNVVLPITAPTYSGSLHWYIIQGYPSSGTLHCWQGKEYNDSGAIYKGSVTGAGVLWNYPSSYLNWSNFTLNPMQDNNMPDNFEYGKIKMYSGNKWNLGTYAQTVNSSIIPWSTLWTAG